MSEKYSHLLSPIKVGDLVLRNRLICNPSTPHMVQGPEPYPSKAMIDLPPGKEMPVEMVLEHIEEMAQQAMRTGYAAGRKL